MAAQRVPDDAFIVKNFALTGAQAEWLRDKAHATRETKAALVRDLLDRAMKAEKQKRGPN